MKLEPHDLAYPRSLCALEFPPTIRVSGPLVAERVFTIAGSRNAPEEARNFARKLGYHLAKAGVVVASGGARGVDRSAHEGALLGGATWLVSPCGSDHVFPPGNEKLLARIRQTEQSRIIWPFEDHVPIDKLTPRFRNGVLVGLSECVIIICARRQSGSRNTARWTRRLGRLLYVVPAAPWEKKFLGTQDELVGGARPLWAIDDFFAQVGLPPPDLSDPVVASPDEAEEEPRRARRVIRPQTFSDAPRFAVDLDVWTEDEKAVFSTISRAPTQLDTIIVRAGLGAGPTLTALLTLSLKDVVVEGPDGFFRSRVDL